MGKYEGINRVETALSVNTVIEKKVEESKKEFRFKGFFISLGVCLVLSLGIFSGKFLPIPRYGEITQTIKNAVEFDLIEYIKTKVKI